MFKKLSNIGDCGIVCDFGDEVSQKINTRSYQIISLCEDSRLLTGNLEGNIKLYAPSYNKLIINFDLQKISAI